MPMIDTHYDFDAPAAQVWDVLEDFAHIERWWPVDGPVQIRKVALEGEGIGMVRHIHNVGMPAPISERLDFLDRDNRTLKLSIVGERPVGLIRYQATGRVRELEEERCRLEYHSEFEVEDGREDEAREFLLAAYHLMFSGVDAAVASE